MPPERATRAGRGSPGCRAAKRNRPMLSDWRAASLVRLRALDLGQPCVELVDRRLLVLYDLGQHGDDLQSAEALAVLLGDQLGHVLGDEAGLDLVGRGL